MKKCWIYSTCDFILFDNFDYYKMQYEKKKTCIFTKLYLLFLLPIELRMKEIPSLRKKHKIP